MNTKKTKDNSKIQLLKKEGKKPNFKLDKWLEEALVKHKKQLDYLADR